MGILEHIILDRVEITNDRVDGQSQGINNFVHVAFGVDQNFIPWMGVLMTSILENNRSHIFVFHIVTNFIAKEDIKRLHNFVQQYQVLIKIYYIDTTEINKLPRTKFISQAMYYRFIIANELYGKVDRVLYLDADILCVGKIDEIIAENIDDLLAVVIEDIFAKHNIKEDLYKRNKKYFNSGVLYININKWCEEKISEKALELVHKNGCLYSCADQDALNILLEDKVIWGKSKYNCMQILRGRKFLLPSDTIFIHFITQNKPWCPWIAHDPLVKIYLQYWENSLWDDVSYDKEPTNYKQARSMAYCNFHSISLLEGIKWYLKYIYWKIKEKVIEK